MGAPRGIRRAPLTPLALLALLASGCAGAYEDDVPTPARAVLAAPDSLAILALDPDLEAVRPGDETFHGYRVLGTAAIPAAAERERLLALVRAGIDEAPAERALCFLPRHGVRAARGEERVDLLLCYECLRIDVVGPGPSRVDLPLGGEREADVRALFRERGLPEGGR